MSFCRVLQLYLSLSRVSRQGTALQTDHCARACVANAERRRGGRTSAVATALAPGRGRGRAVAPPSTVQLRAAPAASAPAATFGFNTPSPDDGVRAAQACR